jgi:hypothetical protein
MNANQKKIEVRRVFTAEDAENAERRQERKPKFILCLLLSLSVLSVLCGESSCIFLICVYLR